MDNKWQKSQELFARAQNSLAGGVSSPFRAKFPVPLYFEDGRDAVCWTWTAMNTSITRWLGDPAILGYRHPKDGRRG